MFVRCQYLITTWVDYKFLLRQLRYVNSPRTKPLGSHFPVLMSKYCLCRKYQYLARGNYLANAKTCQTLFHFVRGKHMSKITKNRTIFWSRLLDQISSKQHCNYAMLVKIHFLLFLQEVYSFMAVNQVRCVCRTNV